MISNKIEEIREEFKEPSIIKRDHLMSKSIQQISKISESNSSFIGFLMITTLVVSAIGNILIIKYNLHLFMQN